MENRFATRPDPEGFSVYDVWTGQTVVIAQAAQDGLSREDADHTAAMLNRRARGGDRDVPQ